MRFSLLGSLSKRFILTKNIFFQTRERMVLIPRWVISNHSRSLSSKERRVRSHMLCSRHESPTSPSSPRVPVTLVHLPVRSLLPRGPRRSCGLFRALASLSRHLCSLCTDWVTPETQRQASPLTGALGSRQTDGRFQPDTGSRAGPCRSHGAQGKEA